MTPTLHGYFRSSASYRVRIALNIKGVPYDQSSVHLSRDGGVQFSQGFRALNPQSLVPVLQDGDMVISQSLAIIEFLEDRYPEPPLLPADPSGKAVVRQLASMVACDIHPLNNLRVLRYLTDRLGVSEEAKLAWIGHWIAQGFEALESLISRAPGRGRFSHGDAPTLADCCLVPQMFNAARFGVPLDAYPTLRAIEAECLKLDAFARAHPSRQPDSE
jgi:maleylpyruvate isomerase